MTVSISTPQGVWEETLLFQGFLGLPGSKTLVFQGFLTVFQAKEAVFYSKVLEPSNKPGSKALKPSK
jgi:hypothetical protein